MSRVFAAAFVLWSATAMASPRGRVVRVERADTSAKVAPRLCEVRGDSGTCVGEEPRAGQTVVLLDGQRAVAEVEIIEAASLMASCANLWTVKTRTVRGGAADTDGIGVIDPHLDPSRARLLNKNHAPASPSGVSSDEVWRAIDRDGDGVADIMITRYSCDVSGRPSAGSATYCIDVWARLGAKMTRTTQLNLAQCTP